MIKPKQVVHQNKVKIVFLISILLIALQPAIVHSVKAVSDTFTEDFTTNDYQDFAETNTSGWGSGIISNPKKALTLTGSYNSPGYASDVFISGNYAYIADGSSGLRVVSISNPSSPTSAGFYSIVNALGIFVEGDYAYIANHLGGLQVLNILNPASPVHAGIYDTPGEAFDIDIEGDYAYIADGSSGLRVVSISNPSSPTSVGAYSTTNATDVFIEGNYAYIADGNSGLRIVSISNPSSPIGTGICPTTNAMGVFVSGNYAYVADGSSGLRVVSILNPSSPTSVGVCSTTNAVGVFVEGDYAYVADDADGLHVVDISDPLIPVLVVSYNTSSSAQDVFIAGNHAYVADGTGGLQILQIGDLVIPTAAGFCSTPYPAQGVYISGDYAYIADGSRGLQVVDISDPTTPTYKTGINTRQFAEDVYISGDYAYIADGGLGLTVVNIVNPLAPTLAGYFDYAHQYAKELIVVGDYAYVTDGNYGLKVYDIRDPTHPIPAGPGVNVGRFVNDVFIAGDYAYLATQSATLEIIDIRNPSSLTRIFTLPLSSYARGVHVSGNYAYLASYNFFTVVDITNPLSPNIVFNNPIGPTYLDSVVVKGDRAYVTHFTNRYLSVLDITNPTHPSLISAISTPNNAYGLFVAGDYAYIANYGTGLSIYEVMRNRGQQYESPGVAQSTTVFSGVSSVSLVSATLTSSNSIPSGTAISYYLSSDNGVNWESVTPGVEHIFTNTGNQLKWKAVMSTTDILKTPVITELTLDYLYHLTEAPSLISPEDGFITNINPPTFEWESIIGASTYLIQVDTSSEFTSPNLINETVSTTSFTPASSLATGTWYWKVAAVDSGDDSGPFSNYRYIIIDTIAPTIDHPDDVTYSEGTVSHFVTWNPSDLNPESYNVTRNGVLIESGTWNGGNIIVSVDVQSRGIYTFICYVYDQAGNSISDEVLVTVQDVTAPTIDHPDDVTYSEGTVNHFVTWNPSDLNPESYNVTRNGVLIESGTWNGGNIIVSVDVQSRGIYTFICYVYDQAGNSISDEVLVTVQDVTAPTIDHPDDVTYSEGTVNHFVTWNPSDLNPESYNVTRNGVLIESGTWNGGNIIVSVDVQSRGIYTFICYVYDQAGNSISDEVLVTVQDVTAPTIDHPDDVTYSEGTVNHFVTWNPSDLNPESYNVTRNGVLIESGIWNGGNIIVSVDVQSRGIYTFICYVYDQAGNSVSDEVMVEVQDVTAPTIDHPDDVTYSEGTLNHNITWNPMDTNPGIYKIYKDGIQVDSGSWDSGTPITINIDNLLVGSYSYTIEIFDLSGNTISDIVEVTVTDTPTTTTTIPFTTTTDLFTTTDVPTTTSTIEEPTETSEETTFSSTTTTEPDITTGNSILMVIITSIGWILLKKRKGKQ